MRAQQVGERPIGVSRKWTISWFYLSIGKIIINLTYFWHRLWYTKTNKAILESMNFLKWYCIFVLNKISLKKMKNIYKMGESSYHKLKPFRFEKTMVQGGETGGIYFYSCSVVSYYRGILGIIRVLDSNRYEKR